MHRILKKYISKLFIQQWVVGVAAFRPEEMIRERNIQCRYHWFPVPDKARLEADPFILKTGEGRYQLLIEDYSLTDQYGKLAMLELDSDFTVLDRKEILDTGSHLSYPFIFRDKGTIYVFPESGTAGNLSCYTWDPVSKKLSFVKVLIEEPLLDSTILFHNNRYWLFATKKGSDADSKLYIYSSEDLLGNYVPHPMNPVKVSQTSSRPAGAFFSVDGVLYRPAQNSSVTYGGSMTINKVLKLSESVYQEEAWLPLQLNEGKKYNPGIHGFHTFNYDGGLSVVDGTRWRFSPILKLKQLAIKFMSNRSGSKAGKGGAA